MVLFHIKADWSTARTEDGHPPAITDIIGILMEESHKWCVNSWDIQVKVHHTNISRYKKQTNKKHHSEMILGVGFGEK